MRTLQVISPLRTRSRRRFVNTMTKVYARGALAGFVPGLFASS